MNDLMKLLNNATAAHERARKARHMAQAARVIVRTEMAA